MRRYLVVANQTLGGDHLLDEVRKRMAAAPASFHIVVPATSPADHAVWTEGEAQALAQKRLDLALARFRDLGADVDGEVGDANPIEAVRDCQRVQEFAEIILSTLPAGVSRWLKQDLPHRMERSCGVPVTHIVGGPERPAETSS
ncbi:MAG TPA: hypothetical protein VHL78_02115 [Actinomycetota bacterium]|nr:hypothetical protein [Actinomycetota bacterium]